MNFYKKKQIRFYLIFLLIILTGGIYYVIHDKIFNQPNSVLLSRESENINVAGEIIFIDYQGKFFILDMYNIYAYPKKEKLKIFFDELTRVFNIIYSEEAGVLISKKLFPDTIENLKMDDFISVKFSTNTTALRAIEIRKSSPYLKKDT